MVSTIKHQSIWFDAAPDEAQFPALSGDRQADIVIIGGGIVGILTAWQLAETGRNVVVLEQNHVVAAESGFTTAFLTRVPDTSIIYLQQHYGADFLKQLVAANRTAQKSLAEIIRSQQLDCDYRECTSFYFSSKTTDAVLTAEAPSYLAADPEAELVSGTQLPSIGLPIQQAIAIRHEAQFHIRKFILQLLQRPLAKQRITVYEETAAADVTVNDRQITIATDAGTIVAKQVIVASGAMPLFFSELKALTVPENTFVLAAQFKEPTPISNDLFWDTEEPYHYLRHYDEHTLILGGCDQSGNSPVPTGEQAPHTILANWLRSQIKQEFTVTHEWSGTLYVSQDGLPYVDEHPAYPGQVYFVTGLNGNGMVMGAMTAKALADKVTGTASPATDLLGLKRTGVTVTAPTSSPVLPSTSGAASRSAALFAWLIPVGYLATIWLPGYLFFQNRGGLAFLDGTDFKTASLLLFPLVGLYAFYFVWAQLLLGANMIWLRRRLPWIEAFHRTQGIFALLFALMHPTLIMVAYGMESYLKMEYVGPTLTLYAWLGEIQLFLICVTVITAILRKQPWLEKYWHYVHYLNYIVFISAWTHSWFLGSDTQIPPMNYLWIGFGVTFLLSCLQRIYRAVRPVPQLKTTGKFVTIAQVGDVPVNTSKQITLGERDIALFNLNGKYYALNNLCSHAGGPLCNGRLSGNTVECPWHHSAFDITTGTVLSGPAKRPQQKFVVKIVGNDIQIKL